MTRAEVAEWLDLAAALYLQLVERELFTEAELKLLTDINGFTVETLNDCLFSRYGYRSLDQMLEEEE